MKNRRHESSKTSEADRIATPWIFIFGDGPVVSEVESALERVNAKLTMARWSQDAVARVDENPTAVVLVAPLLGVSTARAVRAIRERPAGGRVPIFAVQSKVTSQRDIRRLYSEGASAVFEWPEEAAVLPYCLAEMVAANFVRGRASHPDTALARTIRAQIKTRCDFNHRVRVRVSDGVATLSGSVYQLWQKDRITEVALSVPGLKAVVNRDVFVLPTGISDSDVDASIVQMMRDVSEIDEKTLAIRVENGYVTLAGSVDSRTESRRLVQLLTNIRGVRNITPLIVVSPSQKKQDHRIAKHLQTMLDQLFIGEDVKVTFFGSTAVLSGNVSSLFTKQRVAQVLETEDAVERIVNKLNVKGSDEV
jgi:osmotically-inducible protein OsmY